MDVGAGAHEAGIDHGDLDAGAAEFGAKAFGKTDKGVFAGDVGQQVWDTDFAADGGNVHDVAAAATLHVRQGCLNGVERAEEVDPHGIFEGLERLVLKGGDVDDAGVVDEDIDTAVACDCVGNQMFAVFRFGDVADDGKCAGGVGDGTAVVQEDERALKLGGIAGGEDEMGTVATEDAGKLEPKAAAAAGDNDDLAMHGTLAAGCGNDRGGGDGGTEKPERNGAGRAVLAQKMACVMTRCFAAEANDFADHGHSDARLRGRRCVLDAAVK